MSNRGGQINRIVKTPRRVYGAEAKQRIAKELHGIIVSVPTSERHRDWHFDLRRKKLQSWGAMLRLIDVLIEGGAAPETVYAVPEALRAYCEDQLSWGRDRGPKRAA